MSALLASPAFWWGTLLIVIGLLVRRERRLARKHRDAIQDVPSCPIYPIEMYRHRRSDLHATTYPCGVRQSRLRGPDSPQGAADRFPGRTPVGPLGGDAA